ncbi:hypothetical protein C7H19_05610 [Aphanothece hegewaldii CCALA 016]|uniref:VOC domain-containing protein n=1 Tax=Aphanothece hegewaldii CCALA 016 TaxID=2107694 RepID=A0A2T1M1A4_9CHRO|nr:VOC family protein [Aphanothece hegewaldii]PSF38461.1 hypothetical protein C7H19_05610 [Aphanothece hegewaldii CCALA 016]
MNDIPPSPCVWFEIPIARPEITLNFYQQVFQWQLKPFNDAPEDSRHQLWHIYESLDLPCGGLYVNPDSAGKNGIELYLRVENVEKTLNLARKYNGSIVLEKTKRPDGSGFYARIQDPDGNYLGVWGII